MSLSDKLNLLVNRYVRRQIPLLAKENLGNYVQEEYREIEAVIQSLADASIQATDRQPDNSRKGMVRYAISPWDPKGDGSEGLVVYNGTSWVAV